MNKKFLVILFGALITSGCTSRLGLRLHGPDSWVSQAGPHGIVALDEHRGHIAHQRQDALYENQWPALQGKTVLETLQFWSVKANVNWTLLFNEREKHILQTAKIENSVMYFGAYDEAVAALLRAWLPLKNRNLKAIFDDELKLVTFSVLE